MPKTVGKILSFLDKIIFLFEFPATLLGLVLIVFLVYVGVARYFFQMATPYEDEFSLLIHLWMVNLGMSLVVRQGDHVTTKILYDRIVTRGKVGRAYSVFVELVKIAFIILMLWFLYQTFPLLTRGVTEYMRWPFAAYYSALVVGFTFMLIRYVLVTVGMVSGGRQ
ncbi:MAG: TRAP transporter small permease subunit [Zestosphaera sp.]